jgi:hypothetical protein
MASSTTTIAYYWWAVGIRDVGVLRLPLGLFGFIGHTAAGQRGDVIVGTISVTAIYFIISISVE